MHLLGEIVNHGYHLSCHGDITHNIILIYDALLLEHSEHNVAYFNKGIRLLLRQTLIPSFLRQPNFAVPSSDY